MINRAALKDLIRQCRSDPDLAEAVRDALLSFEDYHRAIYTMEIRKKLLQDAADPQQYREEVSALDRKRTACHNAVLANVNMLNRMAAQAGLPPVYDGTVSEDQPFRRQVADAVLSFVREIILERP